MAGDDTALRAALRKISRKRPRWGYRRAHALLLEQGWSVNRKRTQRLWREEGLRVPQRRRKRQRLGESTVRCRRAGCVSAAQTSLLIDQYELAMAGSYLERGMNEPAIFELFVRELPPGRDWLLLAGLGPALRMVAEMRFGDAELRYLETIGFRPALLRFLERFRFSGRIDAIPEGTIAFALVCPWSKRTQKVL